jgi:acyl-CoA thioester hydrolase
MEDYKRLVQIRWSDLDPNFHLRHSVYYDWGAFCRIEFLNQFGLTAEVMHQLQVGPILFREECVFRKEIILGDEIQISLQLTKARSDFSRWSIQHEIIKHETTVAARLSVDGAWIHTHQRKLITPPEQVLNVFSEMPKAKDFSWI